MKTFVLIAITSLVASSYAAGTGCSNVAWDTLEHTFNGPNAAKRASGIGQVSLPRQITVPAGASCETRIQDALIYGIRQQISGDAANNVVGLYDKNGIIAGMQVRFNKSALYDGWNNQFQYDQVPMYRTERNGSIEYFVLTAYFVEPSTICTKGRNAADLNTVNGTGYTLLFQNGPTPSDLLVAPVKRSEALQQNYSNNKCFIGMGNHTFYNVESWQANNCQKTTPVFLLQNVASEGSCMVGFGFAWVGTSKTPIFEQPPKAAVQMIVGKELVPEGHCILNLAEQQRLTTLHVFFTTKSHGCDLIKTGMEQVKEQVQSVVDRVTSWFG